MIPLPTSLFPYWFFPWNTDTWPGFTKFIFHKEILAIDALRQIFVWKDFAFSSLKQGSFPLWNPYNFSGQPLLANFQSSIFYPLSWLFFLPSHLVAWSIYIYIQPLLGGAFMYLFLRGKNLSRLASSFGSLTLILSSYFVTRYFWGVYIHSLLWLPLGLYLIDRFINTKLSLVRFLVFESLVLVFSILGGYPQHGVFVFVILWAYFLVFAGIKRFGVFLASCVLALLISSVQILPTAELYHFSVREGSASREIFTQSLLEPKYLLTILSPDIFGSPATNNYSGGKDYSGVNGYFGIIPFVLSLYALVLVKEKRVRFWFFVALAGLVFSYKTPISYLPEILKLPILSSGGAWNDLFFWQFGGTILSAFGLNELGKRKDTKVFWLGGTVLAVQFVLVILNLGSSVASRNTILVTIPLATFLIISFVLPKLTTKLALLLLLVSGAYYLQKVSPFGDLKYFYPPHPLISYLQENSSVNRYWGVQHAKITSNLATYYRIYSPEGYDSLWPRWYGELISSGQTGEIPSQMNRADIFITDDDTKYRRRLVSLLAVKFVLDRSDKPGGEDGPNLPKFPPEHYSFVKQWGEVAIYQNVDALPRTFLADSYVVASGDQAIKAIYDIKLDLRNALVLEKNINADHLSSGSAEIVDYQPNKVKIHTFSSGQSLLFLSDTYFPGWEASVNGSPVEILRADYAFRAVSVPAGENDVEFVYRPKSFIFGAGASLFGVGIIVWLISSKFFGKRIGQKPS